MDDTRTAWLRHPTRRRMLAAAEEHFAAHGYDAARVDAVAATAGVSKSHLYYHFRSKLELLTGLLDLRVAEILEEKDRLFEGVDTADLFGGDDPAPLASIVRRAIDELLLPRRDVVRIVLVEAIRNPEAARPILAALDAVLADAIERLRIAGLAGVAGGEPDPGRLRDLLFRFGIIPCLFLVAFEEGPVDTAALAADLARLERAAFHIP